MLFIKLNHKFIMMVLSEFRCKYSWNQLPAVDPGASLDELGVGADTGEAVKYQRKRENVRTLRDLNPWFMSVTKKPYIRPYYLNS